MPWKLDDSRIKSLPPKARELWVKVANGYLSKHPNDEVSAIRIAWHAVGEAGFKKEAHRWENTLDKAVAESEMEKMMKNNWFFNSAPMDFMKTEDGEGGKKYVILKASGLDVDKQDERMTGEAIDKMVGQAKAGQIDLLDHHRSSFTMGKSVDGWADTAKDYFIKFEVDQRHANVPQLMDDLSKGVVNKYQASVGGRVKDFAREFNTAKNRIVRVLKDVSLNHVAITRWQDSAYPSAGFVGAVCKEIGEESDPIVEKNGGDFVKEKLLLLMKALNEFVDTASVKVNATMDMFVKDAAGALTLKKEFEEVFSKGAQLDEADKAEIKKGVERLNALLGVTAAPVSKSVEETPAFLSIKKDFEEKLAKSKEEFETLKKDSGVTKEQLQLAMLKTKGLEELMEKISAQPAKPRAGANEKVVQKGAAALEVPGLEKTVGEVNLEKVKKYHEDATTLVKQAATLKRNGELSKEMDEKARIAADYLLDASAVGMLSAAVRRGVVTAEETAA